VGLLKVLSNDMDDAINSFVSPSALADNSTGDDKFNRWKRNELCTEKGTKHANNPIKY
jgi:hypothetical protein